MRIKNIKGSRQRQSGWVVGREGAMMSSGHSGLRLPMRSEAAGRCDLRLPADRPSDKRMCFRRVRAFAPHRIL